MVNYGFMAWVRNQDIDSAYGANLDEATTLDRERLQYFANVLVQRRAIIATPDLWFRLNWRTLRIELEAAGNFGVFDIRDIGVDPTDQGDEYLLDLTADDLERQVVANFGYALEFKYGFFNDNFHIGFDHGFAMGDASRPLDSNPLSPLTAGGNNRLSAFRFNPAYNVDLLLYREVLGTVTNTAYFKPWAAFYFFDHFSVRADVMYAMAARKQATLGDKFSYGIEIDAAARYHDSREPVFFQAQYGVLFPLGAFNRIPADPDRGTADAHAVQTVQAQVGIRF